jgi:sulfite reductase (NADPH) flavoprotein alpha-component
MYNNILHMSDSNTYNKLNPFMAKIKERYSLCSPDSKKQIYHVVLDIEGSGFTYAVGDSIAVYPTHHPELVNRTLQAMHASGDEIVFNKHSQESSNLRHLLTSKLNITSISRKLLSEITAKQTNSTKKSSLEELFLEQQKDTLKEYLQNHELWDLLEENQEVTFSLQDLCNLLMPLLPRFYSIASSMREVGHEVHLTVADLSYYTNQHLRRGVCTYYLCELAPMNHPDIPVYVQPSRGFTVPDNPSANLIMIGPGTGIAPFRGFMQERMALNHSGKNWIFFGEWHKDSNYLYKDFWENLEGKDKLKMELAFSRDQEHKIYVWHRMLEHAKQFYEWLQNGAYIFVCGDAHRMAKDVDAILHRIIQEQSQGTEASAKSYVKQLKAENRYLRDVY